ncbi:MULTISPECIES: hypothetical protein [unclassified Moorena]|uniref:hypothetical protein n=1 Tax=unclassified Moorena TaxID=2683338 RepID=UPI0013FE6FD2|nr:MULTISPECIES: hypothetical protein [unclassified Moorena]NEO14598.1 hypothetical protein [Moorena sp. SIO3E8]NEQ02372.1 hypothetical protein [Moorena sp. SIO3F7]
MRLISVPHKCNKRYINFICYRFPIPYSRFPIPDSRFYPFNYKFQINCNFSIKNQKKVFYNP